jgi:hypothetical protein
MISSKIVGSFGEWLGSGHPRENVTTGILERRIFAAPLPVLAHTLFSATC